MGQEVTSRHIMASNCQMLIYNFAYNVPTPRARHTGVKDDSYNVSLCMSSVSRTHIVKTKEGIGARKKRKTDR
jgi:hypothetical protein